MGGRIVSWLDWLDGEAATHQAEADPDPHGYGPFICKTEQAVAQGKLPDPDKEAGS